MIHKHSDRLEIKVLDLKNKTIYPPFGTITVIDISVIRRWIIDTNDLKKGEYLIITFI